MKKIMIYTKNGFHAHNREGLFTEALKSKAFLIMLISLFFCGSVIGAVIFKNCKEYGFDFLNVFARFTITEQLNKIFFLSIICSSFIAVICMLGGFCGLGISFICMLPVLLGVRYATTASYLLTEYAVKGLGYFCLIQLPGAVIRVTACLYLCDLSCSMSKKVAAGLFGGSREALDIKSYGIKFGLICAFFLLSAIIDCSCVCLFAKLF